ncbi:MAG: acyl-CoA/acyl-ACP dehydrogenase [Thaumarchaeota archaeon]|jgi:acyl-CoA dehydrogenase|nr:acyl-CoA/acyl-ACP dehydrogenase [Candidatus Geocrenenecus arthurdayi]MCL7388852.1 acyl-CoA/acyl-ACP dehydrogenase [Candidatus Geocrenenecus arthurdayi]MCL7391397.1 acyl-CoA/acyl-ACP dehydrogenase [Candidatus Geocrenenecus arthurdayi]MCL7396775.1 acyl-CoA/acyl-ACP dehydrogenase [Candidatus Geocrenenecus arthurdayi]MCL7403913.1 acyl-CoA/acyl-ACP dehydrogenase [Candidatus Geocrenenecus arthurdayi]
MDFELTEEQKAIAESAREIARDFPPEYWREKEEKEEFAEEFFKAISEAGFFGIVIPEEYGGSGYGLTELLIAIEELSANGCGMGGAWYLILTEVLGGLTIARHGTKEQKEKYLPKIAKGQIEFCMALTEPDAGTNTLAIKTFARREGDEWIINGNKIFISGIDRARGMLLIARTTPLEKAPKKTFGLSLFLVDLPNESVKASPIPKHGINYSKSCEVSISELRVPSDSLIPPVDEGWYILLDTLNPERMSFTSAAIGISKLAIKKAVEYSKHRRVFADPIGSYQGLQFPLAEAYAMLECARLMNFKAAWLFDHKADYRSVGETANIAKTVAVEAGIKAVYWAMQTFGGYGYAKEYDVERWWREINLIRLAPVTQQMTLNYIAEHVLGMPKSYR